jgi:hypothetical protein
MCLARDYQVLLVGAGSSGRRFAYARECALGTVQLRLKALGQSEALEVDRAALDRTLLLQDGLIPEGWVALHTSAEREVAFTVPRTCFVPLLFCLVLSDSAVELEPCGAGTELRSIRCSHGICTALLSAASDRHYCAVNALD